MSDDGTFFGYESFEAMLLAWAENLTAYYERNPQIVRRGDQVIYIMGFEGDIVKVGQTTDYTTRMAAHRSDRKVRGKQLLNSWCEKTTSALEHERVLVRLAGELGGSPLPNAREWFSGVDALALMGAVERELFPEEDVAA